jgi:hypothetical protein
MKSATRMESMSRTNPNRMVRTMPRTAPRQCCPDPQSGRHLREALMSLPGTTIQRDPRDGQPWCGAAMF